MLSNQIHDWTTNKGTIILPSQQANCRAPIEVTRDDVENCVKAVPKIATLVSLIININFIFEFPKIFEYLCFLYLFKLV